MNPRILNTKSDTHEPQDIKDEIRQHMNPRMLNTKSDTHEP